MKTLNNSHFKISCHANLSELKFNMMQQDDNYADMRALIGTYVFSPFPS